MDPTVEVRTRFEIYCDILYRGILEIRASTRDYEYISEQADHLHNLPGLLREMNNEDLHRFYWKCMRIDYGRSGREDWPRIFDSLWIELGDATEREAGYRPENIEGRAS